ncbi:4659_t:CDS:1, partial [Racocetra persica]
IFTKWKEAPKICFYCDKEGYIKRDYKELKASIETRRLLREAKEQRENAKSIASNSPKIAFSQDNPYINQETL